MSNLSELLPSGGGQNVVEFTASGAVASGKPVILNSDGTVTEVAAVSQNIGTESAFEGARVDYINATYDSGNGKIVVVYKLQSDGRGYAVVGTVSGTSISFGTPVVFPQSFVYNPDVTYDANAGKIVIAYRGGSFDYGYSVVGTVSGTSISFGTEVVYKSAAVSKSGIAYDSSAQKVVIAYRQGSTSDGVALVGTVSGTSISFGSETTFDSGNANTSQNMSVVYDVAADKTVIGYQNNNAGGVLTAIVGTVSGTSISFGSSAAANSTQALYVAGTYDSTAQKIVYSYRDAGNSDYGTAVVGTVSGTSISFGTPVVFDNSGVITYIKPSYNAAANKTLIAYTDATASYVGEVIEATVSGTSLTFANQATFNSTTPINYVGATYDSANEKNVIAYLENYASGEGQVITVSGTNLTATNFIGLASAAISDTASGDINVKGGINEAQTGLTIGSDYYVQNDGSLEGVGVVIPYKISGASYTNKSFSVTQDTNPWSISFNSTQSKMYVTGGNTAAIYQYSLSTAGDVSTASYDSVSFSVSSQDSNPNGMAFNNDGTKMFVLGNNTDTVYQYSLSSAFDMSSASYDSVSFSVASQETTPRSIRFNNDGTSMYVAGTVTDSVYQYTLTSAFDLSTASYASKTFSFTSETSDVRAVLFNGDGTKMFMLDGTNDDLKQYSLSTAFDVSTASYDSVSFDVSSQDNNPLALHFNSDGTVFYYAGNNTDTIYQYDVASGSTSGVKVGQAITATTINMMDLT